MLKGNKIKNIGIYHRKDPETQKEAQEIIAWLKDKGYRVFQPPFSYNIDLLIVLGGDGSLLKAARMVWPMSVPILGINFGQLGFLTAVDKRDAKTLIEQILKGDITDKIDKRMVVEGKVVGRNGQQGPYMALNEVTIERGAWTHLMTLSINVNKEKATRLRADGIIVATPTGSTAYSLSAGGPIVHPKLDAIILTSICPFHLVHRSLVLHPESIIEIGIDKGGDGIRVVFDGQIFVSLKTGDKVEIRKSPRPVYLITHEFYFNVLRQKLNWGC